MASDEDLRREATSGKLADEITALVSRAAAAILSFAPATAARRDKPDRSPVSEADEAAEAILVEGLARLVPGLPIVSEEAACAQMPASPGRQFILVDPLDGTREFLDGRDDFTVNVALVIDGAPALGVIAAPALGRIWRGIVRKGAERLDLAPGDAPRRARRVAPLAPRRPPARLVAAVSRSHLDERTAAFVGGLPDVERIVCGSSLKFCRLAEGGADLYPRLAPIREWDIAAGHAVLAASGGVVVTPDGAPIAYGGAADGFLVRGFLAFADPALAQRFKV